MREGRKMIDIHSIQTIRQEQWEDADTFLTVFCRVSPLLQRQNQAEIERKEKA